MNTYNLQQIPILEIASLLGIRVTRNKAMCFRGHDRKTASLSFSPQKNLWHCFGCNVGGNNFTLVKEYYGYTPKETMLWFNQKFNVRPHLNIKTNSIEKISLNISDKPSDFQTDSEIYEAFISKCSLSDKGEKYLIQRGFTKKTTSHFCIKDILNTKTIENWLTNRYDKSRLMKSGLMVERHKKLCLVWWDHTILFPFFDHGKIVYIQGRRLVNEGSSYPKYINLKGVAKPLFNKDILDSLPKGSKLYICEGIPDAITAYEMNKNAVGVLGATSFKKEWTYLMRSFNIAIIPDSDESGTIFAESVQSTFLKIGKIAQIECLPFGKDLNEYFQKLINGVK